MRKMFRVRFNVDEERAVSIAGRLYDNFYNRRGFFRGYEMPEYILPEDVAPGSIEHAWYLTFVVSVDYMVDAVKLWQRAREIYGRYPERFNPQVVMDLEERTLRSLLKELGVRYPKTAAKTWRRIARILVERYGCDPRNITPEPLTIRQVKLRLREFPYLRGSKLSNFYLRAMGESGLFKISDFNELDVPVDIQVARFTFYTGVLKIISDSFEGCVHRDPLRSLIEEVWRVAAGRIGVSPWKLDEPIWTVGSKLCAKRLCRGCPVEDLCDKVKGIRFKGAIMTWERPQIMSGPTLKNGQIFDKRHRK